MDTPQGTWRYDSKTGKWVWRKLGNPFPKVPNNSHKEKTSKHKRK